MNTRLAGLGLLPAFVAAFLPWIYSSSGFLAVGSLTLVNVYQFAFNDVIGYAVIAAIGQDTIATLVLILYPIALLWSLYAISTRAYSIMWPGILLVISPLLWLYDGHTQGTNTQFDNVSGPYVAAVGGLLTVFSMLAGQGMYRKRWR